MVPVPAQLKVSFRDRVTFMIDDIREKLLSSKARGGDLSKITSEMDDRAVQSFLRSSATHLGALSDKIEDENSKIELDPEDKATLVMIEKAICGMSNKYHGIK